MAEADAPSSRTPKLSRAGALALVTLAYVLAAAVAVGVGFLAAPLGDAVYVGALADAAATVVVFAFSLLCGNSSFYDAYWSVAPPALVLYFYLNAARATDYDKPAPERAALVLGAVALWSVRLTTNWAIGWTGLAHEDWRYRKIREDIQARGLGPALYWILGAFLVRRTEKGEGEGGGGGEEKKKK